MRPRTYRSRTSAMRMLMRFLGHRVIRRVQDPAFLLRQIEPRRTEDVDQLIASASSRLRRMDAWRRNDRDRRRADARVIIVDPLLEISGPRDADVVDVFTLEHERALFEIVVAVRRHAPNVARTDVSVAIVDHEVGRAEDRAEAGRILRR